MGLGLLGVLCSEDYCGVGVIQVQPVWVSGGSLANCLIGILGVCLATLLDVVILDLDGSTRWGGFCV